MLLFSLCDWFRDLLFSQNKREMRLNAHIANFSLAQKVTFAIFARQRRYGRFYQFSQQLLDLAVLDLGLISIASLGLRASTKVESHVNFTESQ